MKGFHVVCFSKDRAFQLSEYLRTLTCYLQGGSQELRVTVLYRAEPGSPFYESYKKVAHRFPDVIFIRETDFSKQLIHIVESTKQDFIMFGVDDVLFYERFDLRQAGLFLNHADAHFAFHLKLHPGITFCHPANSVVCIPELRSLRFDKAKITKASSTILCFKSTDGSHDWSYPWELCATVYRRTDVCKMLQCIQLVFGNDGFGHPNLLEANGHAILRKLQKIDEGGTDKGMRGQADSAVLLNATKELRAKATICGCPSVPILSVLTINRVQDVFANPVYIFRVDEQDHNNGTDLDRCLDCNATRCQGHEDLKHKNNLAWLDELLHQNRFLSIEHYRCSQFCSVHIGDFVLDDGIERVKKAQAQSALNFKTICVNVATSNPVVSIVLPVYNGQKYINGALQSIEDATASTGLRTEIVVVDDGSTDFSATIVRGKDVIVHDSHHQNFIDFMTRNKNENLETRLLQLPQNFGIVKALNAGLADARGEFIARLDCDDECMPSRFVAQLRYLHKHPEVAAVGSAIELISDMSEAGHNTTAPFDLVQVGKIVTYPCHPLLLRWRMLFSCVMSHPAIMIRRLVLRRAGGFSSLYPHAEDYHLWLKMLYPNSSSSLTHTLVQTKTAKPMFTDIKKVSPCVNTTYISNLGQVLVRHRKHCDSVSARHRIVQRFSASLAARDAIRNLLRGHFTQEHLHNFGKRSGDFAAIAVIRHGAAGAAKWFETEREFGVAGSKNLVPPKLTLSHLTKGVALLLQLESAFFATTTGQQKDSVDAPNRLPCLSEIVSKTIRCDVTARIGEISMYAVGTYPGMEAFGLMQEYVMRSKISCQ